MQNIVLEFQLESKHSSETPWNIMKPSCNITRCSYNEKENRMNIRKHANVNSNYFRFHTVALCRNISFALSASLTAKSIMFYLEQCYRHTLRYASHLLRCAIFKGSINIEWMCILVRVCVCVLLCAKKIIYNHHRQCEHCVCIVNGYTYR